MKFTSPIQYSSDFQAKYTDLTLITKGYLDNLVAQLTPNIHTHTISDVTGLQTLLNSLQASINTKAATTDVSSLQTTLNSLQAQVNTLTNYDDAALKTRISKTESDITAINTSKADRTTATTTAAGLLSPTDKTKLDTVASNANNYVHPVSHAISEVTGLQTALNTKADASSVVKSVNGSLPDSNGNVTIATTGGGTAYDDTQIKARIATVEADVDSLENTVAGLANYDDTVLSNRVATVEAVAAGLANYDDTQVFSELNALGAIVVDKADKSEINNIHNQFGTFASAEHTHTEFDTIQAQVNTLNNSVAGLANYDDTQVFSEINTLNENKADKTALATLATTVNAHTHNQYIKTVNSIAPDANGNVVVAGGTGGAGGAEETEYLTMQVNYMLWWDGRNSSSFYIPSFLQETATKHNIPFDVFLADNCEFEVIPYANPWYYYELEPIKYNREFTLSLMWNNQYLRITPLDPDGDEREYSGVFAVRVKFKDYPLDKKLSKPLSFLHSHEKGLVYWDAATQQHRTGKIHPQSDITFYENEGHLNIHFQNETILSQAYNSSYNEKHLISKKQAEQNPSKVHSFSIDESGITTHRTSFDVGTHVSGGKSFSGMYVLSLSTEARIVHNIDSTTLAVKVYYSEGLADESWYTVNFDYVEKSIGITWLNEDINETWYSVKIYDTTDAVYSNTTTPTLFTEEGTSLTYMGGSALKVGMGETFKLNTQVHPLEIFYIVADIYIPNPTHSTELKFGLMGVNDADTQGDFFAETYQGTWFAKSTGAMWHSWAATSNMNMGWTDLWHPTYYRIKIAYTGTTRTVFITQRNIHTSSYTWSRELVASTVFNEGIRYMPTKKDVIFKAISEDMYINNVSIVRF